MGLTPDQEKIYKGLKRAIEETKQDKQNNKILWFAQYNDKDVVEGKIIKLGYRKERHLFHMYYDFDLENSDRVGSSESEIQQKIYDSWGDLQTFKLV